MEDENSEELEGVIKANKSLWDLSSKNGQGYLEGRLGPHCLQAVFIF